MQNDRNRVTPSGEEPDALLGSAPTGNKLTYKYEKKGPALPTSYLSHLVRGNLPID
jgi:hypothetical protein